MSKQPKRPQMPKVPTTGSERWNHLHEQMHFLQKSCRDFDAGDLAEAKRMSADVVKLVFNEGGSFKSVLHQVGLMPGMGFISTVSQGFLPHKLLTIKIQGDEATYQAPLGRSPPEPYGRHRIMTFEDWWNETVIGAQGSQLNIPRWQIVRSLRDQQGGAHVDPDIDKAMADVQRDNPTGVTWHVGGIERGKLSNLDLHTMRQIAHEVLISIDRKLAKNQR